MKAEVVHSSNLLSLYVCLGANPGSGLQIKSYSGTFCLLHSAFCLPPRKAGAKR